MEKLAVWYEGWGERWQLGTLAQDGHPVLFEYSAEALRQQLELSPIRLPLRAQAFTGFPAYLHRLPGLIADCLPDGWGMLLMDRLFAQQRRPLASVSVLTRLAYVGARAIGALTFEPAQGTGLEAEDVELLALAQEAQHVLADEETTALRKLLMLGGTPHGARPKVLVHYDPDTGRMATTPAPGLQPWLVKFQARQEHKEACAIEWVYSALARLCGLDMSATRYFDLGLRHAAFGIERFDVQDGLRVPVHTLAGALHVDFTMPGAVDYTMFLRATKAITRSEEQVRKAFDRAVFNVLFNNRDDHPKNFSYRLRRERRWELAPAYDLSFNEGPNGEHQMAVHGHGKKIGRSVMLDLAASAQLDVKWAATRIDSMLDVASGLSEHLDTQPIRQPTRRSIAATVAANARLLG
jgi:serine/threonine-protein kinase HipA